MRMLDDQMVSGVEISRPEKELIPAAGSAGAVTKLDLASYYSGVAAAMVPFLRDRPVNMQRFPDGIHGPSFYEKKAPSHFPDFVNRVEVNTSDGEQHQVVAGDERSLVYLADQACITPHTWLSTSDDLERPDQLVFDLDPSVAGLAAVRRATRLVGDLLDDLGLTTYLKTTGSRGYHVLVPLRRAWTFDEVRTFARGVAEVLVEREPDLLTLEARKDKRGDRILVDVQRNGYGQTAVPPYAVRALPRAPVSTPIRWDELSRVRPDQYTIRSIGRRLANMSDPWKGLRRRGQRLDKASERLHKLKH
jgi:bifunctional non-homologous end joining protein LigD